MKCDEVDGDYFERLGAQTEIFFENCFRAWGTSCAKNPWLVLFLGKLCDLIIFHSNFLLKDLFNLFKPGFCFITTMGHGIKYLKITTDPVELWAAPNSQSRIEREYFDSNFEPFYRIEQVFTFNHFFSFAVDVNNSFLSFLFNL